MNVDKTRIETDSFWPVEVPAAHYWGAQTQRSPGPFRGRLANHAVGDRSRLGDGQAR
jgi:fumarate hydratase class II